jgi:hypothetical protein
MPDSAPENPTASSDTPLGPATSVSHPDEAGSATVPASQAAPVPPEVPGYEIEGVLGRGGMGVVYQARHLALKRRVALKVILAVGHAGEVERARFRAEAEAVARLQHPGIVQVFEVGEHQGLPFCALELVEGGSLAQKLGGLPLPPREAARLVEAVARAVQLAHSRNVVHRDLKPSNILLTPDGHPKVADFGLARQLDADSGATQAGMVMGTPSYMAPEQASGRAHEAGPPADVYSLGAILYQCLTARPPFRGASTLETLEQVRSQEPLAPRSLNPAVPRDLETICLKCLRKEPESRYTSAAALADDLRRWQDGEPVQARQVGKMERAWKWARRNPVVAALLILVLLAVAGGVSGTWLEYLDAREQWHVAEGKKKEAEAARDELKAANSELEGALARNWLTPLEPRAIALSPAEVAALTQLSQFRGRPLAQRFLAEAIRTPDGLRRLRARREHAVQAAVGLDPVMRAEAEHLLLGALEEADRSEEARTDLALTLAALGDLSPAATAAVTRQLIGALETTTAPAERLTLQDGLAEGATRMASGEASETVESLLRVLERVPARDQLSVTRCLLPVTARLASEEAARVTTRTADLLLRTLEKLTVSDAQMSLASALADLTARMEPDEAIAVLEQALVKASAPDARQQLGRTLVSAARRQGPTECSRICARAAARFSQALPESSVAGQATLGLAIASLAAELSPREAVVVLIQALDRARGDSALSFLSHPLPKTIARMKPDTPLPEAGEWAGSVTRALTRTSDYFARGHLAEALAAVSTRMAPADAAAVLTRVLGRSESELNRKTLAAALAAVAARLPADESFRVASDAADLLSRSTEQASPRSRLDLAEALAALSVRLSPEQARQAAAEAVASLRTALDRTTDRTERKDIARRLGAVVGRLGPDEAARVAADAAGALQLALQKAANRADQQSFAEALAVVAARMTPEEGARAAARAGATLHQGLDQATDSDASEYLARGLAALAGLMPPRDAFATLHQAAKKTPNPMAHAAVGRALAVELTRLPPDEAARAAAEAAATFIRALEAAPAGSQDGPASALTAVAPHMAPGAAADLILRALDRTTHPIVLTTLARGLAAIAPQMPPAEAERVASEAARRVLRELARSTGSFRMSFPQALGALAPWLGPQTAREAALALIPIVGKTYETGAGAVRALAARLPAEEAARITALAAAELIPEITRTSPDTRAFEERALAALLDDSGRIPKAAALASAAGCFGDPAAWPAVPALVASALEPPRRLLSDQQLVDLLAHPLCTGPARRILLDQLGDRHGRPFADQWEFVRFARE